MYANKSLARKSVFVFIRGRGYLGFQNKWGGLVGGDSHIHNYYGLKNFLENFLK